MISEHSRSWARHAARIAFSAAALAALSACNPEMIRGGGAEEGVKAGGFGCAISKCVAVVLPPRMVEVGGFRRVALVAVNPAGRPIAPGSDVLVTRLESEISKVRVNEAIYYQIVPANDPRRDATYEFSTTGNALPVVNSTEQRSVCNDGGSSKLFAKCKNSSTVNVSCQTRKGAASSTVRVKRRDNSIIATRMESVVHEAKYCNGDTGALPSEAEVIGVALAKLADKIQDSLAVSSKMMPVRVKDDPAGFADASRAARFKETISFFRDGRLDRACPVFEEMVEIETKSVALFYDHAFCLQAKGDWQRANQYYRQADALTRSPDRDIATAIEETRLSTGGPKLNN